VSGFWLLFTAPEEHHAFRRPAKFEPVLVHAVPGAGCKIGATTLLIAPDGLKAAGATTREPPRSSPSSSRIGGGTNADWVERMLSLEPLSIHFFTHEQRAQSRETWHRLGLSPSLFPFIALYAEKSCCRAYHYVTSGPAGALYTAFHHLEIGEDAGIAGIAAAYARSEAALDRIRPGLNAAMWHTKWMAEFELERKFTFSEVLDTWAASRRLHDEISSGAWPGFIPEFNEEFHVWDYDNEIFEVFEPQGRRGYISFIRQADGQVTIKHKKFEADSELRQEKLTNNAVLGAEDYAAAAARLTGGSVRRLPGFRRKRFDCDLESLDTGNAFGIFFDICRSFEYPDEVLCQCEVEYLRTRAFTDPQNVEVEFQSVCALTREFLRREDVDFREDYYSKLSFARDVAKRRGVNGAARA
jgi:hypothetical protein